MGARRDLDPERSRRLGLSGQHAKVGALAEFLEAIRVGRVLRRSVLIIESIDRLSRTEVGEALQLFISVLNSGVSIATREPRWTYTQDSVNAIASLLEPLQAGRKARVRVMGWPGEFETNLFTGIVFHAEDRTRMSVHTFRQSTTPGRETRPYRYLTSGATAAGATRRGKGLSFPYPPFGQGVLHALPELQSVLKRWVGLGYYRRHDAQALPDRLDRRPVGGPRPAPPEAEVRHPPRAGGRRPTPGRW